MMINKDEINDNDGSVVVGTQILDPNMPSNIDFDNNQEIQLKEIKPPQPQSAYIVNQDDNLFISSYSVKGQVIFSLPAKYPVGSIAPNVSNTIHVYDLSNQKGSGGIWGIWESLVGYVSSEIVIQEGYIYVFVRQKGGMRCTAQWRLVDLFKVFIDKQEMQLRLVLKVEGSNQLMSYNLQSDQLGKIMACLKEQISSIGLSMI